MYRISLILQSLLSLLFLLLLSTHLPPSSFSIPSSRFINIRHPILTVLLLTRLTSLCSHLPLSCLSFLPGIRPHTSQPCRPPPVLTLLSSHCTPLNSTASLHSAASILVLPHTTFPPRPSQLLAPLSLLDLFLLRLLLRRRRLRHRRHLASPSPVLLSGQT